MLRYKTGDLFANLPQNKNVIIPHIVNTFGAWGAGFVVPLGKKLPLAKLSYLRWFGKPDASDPPFSLGSTQFVDVGGKVVVANMLAQSGLVSSDNLKPIKYAALMRCMEAVFSFAKTDNCQVIAPLFGSALAGGNWDFIEELINEIWIPHIEVTIFQLPGQELRTSTKD